MSSSSRSTSSVSSLSSDHLDEFLAERRENSFDFQGYKFQPTRSRNSSSSEEESNSNSSCSSTEAVNNRLQNLNWYIKSVYLSFILYSVN